MASSVKFLALMTILALMLCSLVSGKRDECASQNPQAARTCASQGGVYRLRSIGGGRKVCQCKFENSPSVSSPTRASPVSSPTRRPPTVRPPTVRPPK
mmetsp:Transcript_12189/g.24864  ORF Transcript_12189/g.24864 Transcript_12189/m.24864 type:complete len:98 (+) Transcript_12189:75-368(+)